MRWKVLQKGRAFPFYACTLMAIKSLSACSLRQ